MHESMFCARALSKDKYPIISILMTFDQINAQICTGEKMADPHTAMIGSRLIDGHPPGEKKT